VEDTSGLCDGDFEGAYCLCARRLCGRGSRLCSLDAAESPKHSSRDEGGLDWGRRRKNEGSGQVSQECRNIGGGGQDRDQRPRAFGRAEGGLPLPGRRKRNVLSCGAARQSPPAVSACVAPLDCFPLDKYYPRRDSDCFLECLDCFLVQTVCISALCCCIPWSGTLSRSIFLFSSPLSLSLSLTPFPPSRLPIPPSFCVCLIFPCALQPMCDDSIASMPLSHPLVDSRLDNQRINGA
jgi:hypothetical protein